jgi:flagellar hook-associated protein 2
MASSSLSIGGLVSGLDTNSIIDGLTAIEQSKVSRVKTQQSNTQLALTSYGDLMNRLTGLQAKAKSIDDPKQFDKYTTTTTDTDIATITGNAGGQPGNFRIEIFQRANEEKIATLSYASSSVALGQSGTFKIRRSAGYRESNPLPADAFTNSIVINATDSLKDIRDKINADKDSGARATVINISATEARLVISSVDTGAEGLVFQEETGAVLRDMGVLNAAGAKDIVKQQVQSAAVAGLADAATTFASLGYTVSNNETISISGVDKNGNTVKTGVFVITDVNASVQSFLDKIEQTFNGMVKATVSGGRIVLEDKSGGSSALSASLTANNELGGTLDLGGGASIKQAGYSTVMNEGRDAFFRLDGLNLQTGTNTPDDVVDGIQINLLKAEFGTEVDLGVERDIDGIKKNVQSFLDEYNALVSYLKEQTKVTVKEKNSEPGEDTSKKDQITKGPLANDSTISRLKNELSRTLTAIFDDTIKASLGTNLVSLSSAGITSNGTTGEYTLDDEKFTNAIKQDYNGIRRLFVTQGSTNNPNVQFGRATEKTQAGVFQIDTDNNTINGLAATRAGDVLTQDLDTADPTYGLSVTAPAGNGLVELTFTKGVGRRFSDLVTAITDKFDGYIKQRQDGLQKRIDEYLKRIEALQTHVDNFRQGLVNQFAALEKTLSNLKSQGANMQSAMSRL